MTRVRIGTRGSQLALRQTEIVAEALTRAVPDVVVEIRVIKTEGDRRQDVSLEQVGGQGVFVKDIEAGLLAGEIDLAVHSLKDMPATEPAGLTIGAVLQRADVRDVLVSRGDLPLDRLQHGARVGTDSRRRSVQLLALRPDLRVESIRGNVDSRVKKADSGEYDAVVLAAAGLDRLGLERRIAHVFEPESMLPAVGQAVLAVQCRAGDAAMAPLLARIDHPQTRAAITAERALLRRLGAGCRLPVGAYGEVVEGSLRLRGMLATEDGRIYRDEASVNPHPRPLPHQGEGSADGLAEAEALGSRLADRLMAAAGVSAVT